MKYNQLQCPYQNMSILINFVQYNSFVKIFKYLRYNIIKKTKSTISPRYVKMWKIVDEWVNGWVVNKITIISVVNIILKYRFNKINSL